MFSIESNHTQSLASLQVQLKDAESQIQRMSCSAEDARPNQETAAEIKAVTAKAAEDLAVLEASHTSKLEELQAQATSFAAAESERIAKEFEAAQKKSEKKSKKKLKELQEEISTMQAAHAVALAAASGATATTGTTVSDASASPPSVVDITNKEKEFEARLAEVKAEADKAVSEAAEYVASEGERMASEANATANPKPPLTLTLTLSHRQT